MFVALGERLKMSKPPPPPPPALLHLLCFLSLGLLVRLGGGEVAGQRGVVAVPQLVELGGLGLAAAGAAVPETGQGRTQFGAFGGHRALDGLAQLERKGGERCEVQLEGPRGRWKLCESEAGLSPLGSLRRAHETLFA